MTAMTSKQSRKFLALVRPALVNLIAILDELNVLSQQLVDIRCQESESPLECVRRLIEAYGVTLSSELLEDYKKLLLILQSLDAVGERILLCIGESQGEVPLTPTARPVAEAANLVMVQTAFKEVFSGGMVFNYDPTANFAETSYDKGVVTITLADDTFYFCEPFYPNPQPNAPSITAVVEGESYYVPCPDDENRKIVKGIDGNEIEVMWKWRQAVIHPTTARGVIRHEIGHGFLNRLIDAYGGDESRVKDMYLNAVGELEEDLRKSGAIDVNRRYFFNSFTRREEYGAEAWKEDFSDSFSMFLRSFVGASEFRIAEDEALLVEMERHKVFNESICCWVWEIMGQPERCKEAEILR